MYMIYFISAHTLLLKNEYAEHFSDFVELVILSAFTSFYTKCCRMLQNTLENCFTCTLTHAHSHTHIHMHAYICWREGSYQ